jgi:hypothetical protein
MPFYKWKTPKRSSHISTRKATERAEYINSCRPASDVSVQPIRQLRIGSGGWRETKISANAHRATNIYLMIISTSWLRMPSRKLPFIPCDHWLPLSNIRRWQFGDIYAMQAIWYTICISFPTHYPSLKKRREPRKQMTWSRCCSQRNIKIGATSSRAMSHSSTSPQTMTICDLISWRHWAIKSVETNNCESKADAHRFLVTS